MVTQYYCKEHDVIFDGSSEHSMDCQEQYEWLELDSFKLSNLIKEHIDYFIEE